MPIFKVLRRVDAWWDDVAEVEADDAEDAAWLAKENENDYVWHHDGVQCFDTRGFVTLNDKGDEIEASRCGDF